MIFGKTNVPLRLFYDIPDYSTDKGVKAEVYAPGTSSGGSSLIATVTLTHNAGIPGRYEVLYTPPDGYGDLLSVRYIVYTDTGYTDKFIGYGVGSEQIVLNSGVGQLGGGGGSFGITPKDVTDIAEKVWQFDVSKIEVKDSAAVWLKKDYTGLIDDGVKSVTSFIDALEKKVSRTEANTSVISDVLKRLKSDAVQQTKTLVSKIQTVVDANNKGTALVIEKIKMGTDEQEKILKEHFDKKTAGVMVDILADFQREFIQKTVVSISEVLSLNYGTIEMHWSGKKL